jgi:hypothetical protein
MGSTWVPLVKLPKTSVPGSKRARRLAALPPVCSSWNWLAR